MCIYIDEGDSGDNDDWVASFPILSGLFLVVCLPVAAQDPGPAAVPAGKGAYAASIPAGVALDGRTHLNKAAEFDDKPVYVLNDDGRPIPSNHWDSSLIYQNYGVGLWSYPLRVDTSGQGFQAYFPTQWNSEGRDMQADHPLQIGGKEFQPTGTKAKDWSDWMVSFRLGESADKFIDATLGEGMPYLWLEYHGTAPTIQFDAAATYFDLQGAPLPLPATGDAIGVDYGGRQYGIFAPDGTKFEANGTGLAITFSGASQFLVICPLPTAKDIATFHSFAFAVPRETTLSWQYDPVQGTISTDWKIKTEALKGTETRIIQGWLPHHYRTTTSKLDFNGIDYATARGTMHCAVGNDFTLSYPFAGILPNLPAPKPAGGEHDFNPARLQAALAEIAAKPSFGGDTYWGGKDLVRNGQAALIARETNDPSRDALVNALRAELTNWFTYTPGKTDHLFAYYPKKKGLVGFHSSFGSEEFTDNHFHYGYFTFASALLAMQDPSFATDYGPMAKLVAKQYANWDRDDKRFPFLRTFDVWQGHSWAGGVGSANGTNNQESSSEATQSWTGLILLGQALGDKDMTAAGIMGYTFESQATMEYWFNAHGDVFPSQWKHPITGMVWSAGLNYGTWFSGDPAWIFGIQWVPSSPSLSYFVRDPAWARQNWETMLKEYAAHQEEDAARKPGRVAKEADIKSFDGDLASYFLGYVLMYDPAWVDQKLDELADAPGFAHNPWLANIYYMAHSMAALGHIDWSCHGDSATTMVYLNDATKTRTYVAWNPLPQSQTVKFFEGSKPLGQMVAAPQSLSSDATLT
ncbi:MAG TPA: glycosyl hydrolase, partial [Candidatus Methylacidiphilales bacterium]